ncbi:hypothetical protein WMY93_015110 [Mugilogobius chulae]|uniref:Uncharacterized protein n=1 Tax=Mugilogobius chulae TaxID=88201 RepID=A0AAW0NWJ1_9GOBI
MARDFPRPGPEPSLDIVFGGSEERPTLSPDQVEAGELEVSSPLVPLRHSPAFAPSDEEDLSDTYSVRLSESEEEDSEDEDLPRFLPTPPPAPPLESPGVLLDRLLEAVTSAPPRPPPLPPVPANVDDLILSPPRRRPREEDDEDQEERPRSKRPRLFDCPWLSTLRPSGFRGPHPAGVVRRYFHYHI